MEKQSRNLLMLLRNFSLDFFTKACIIMVQLEENIMANAGFAATLAAVVLMQSAQAGAAGHHGHLGCHLSQGQGLRQGGVATANDHHRLAEHGRDLLRDETRVDVARAAGGRRRGLRRPAGTGRRGRPDRCGRAAWPWQVRH